MLALLIMLPGGLVGAADKQLHLSAPRSGNVPSKISERKCSYLVVLKSRKLWALTKLVLATGSMELVCASIKGALHKINLRFPLQPRKIAAA